MFYTLIQDESNQIKIKYDKDLNIFLPAVDNSGA